MSLIMIVVIWVVAMVLGAVIAGNKGRSILGWIILAGLFPITILILLVLPNKKILAAVVNTHAPGHPGSSAQKFITEEKTCPDCAEMVRKDAKICKHCRYEFAPAKLTINEMRTKDPFTCPHCQKPMPKTQVQCFTCGEKSYTPLEKV